MNDGMQKRSNPEREKMGSQYLDFVDKGEDVEVYTKKTKQRLYAGYIKKKNAWGEAKFVPKDGIVFGKHCLLALSRECSEIDRQAIQSEKSSEAANTSVGISCEELAAMLKKKNPISAEEAKKLVLKMCSKMERNKV